MPKNIVETVREPLVVLSCDLKILSRTIWPGVLHAGTPEGMKRRFLPPFSRVKREGDLVLPS